MKINVHGGHNRNVPGIISYLDEVTEDRKIAKEVISLIKKEGHTAYNCTDDSGRTQISILKNICKKCNAHTVDLDASVHLNGIKKSKKDGKNKGAEIWLYSKDSKAEVAAKRILENLEELGFKNRGVKYKKSYYFLKHSKNPAMIIETCFADDEDDAILYKKLGANRIAKAIAEGLINKNISAEEKPEKPSKPVSKEFQIRTNAKMAVRKGPGMTYKKVMNAPIGVYTITETRYNGKTPWGRLKSGAGWMSIHSKFCKRL